jgi:hypothetical protein
MTQHDQVLRANRRRARRSRARPCHVCIILRHPTVDIMRGAWKADKSKLAVRLQLLPVLVVKVPLRIFDADLCTTRLPADLRECLRAEQRRKDRLESAADPDSTYPIIRLFIAEMIAA